MGDEAKHAARYAYEGLDRLFHEKARLKTFSVLVISK